MGNQFLDFKDISAKVPFSKVLDYYGIPYEGDTWKGNTGKFNFIIDPKKNVFFVPQNKDIKGGVINFVGHQEGLDLRGAAKFLVDKFLKDDYKSKKEIPELELQYDKFLEDKGFSEEFCKKWEIGRFKGRGIMAGKITAKCHDHDGNKIGYVGYDTKKDKWFYPKGFRRPVYNPLDIKHCILVPGLFDCLHLIEHFPFTSALLGASMTDSQEEYLAKMHQRILLIHPKGENVRNRLSKHCFVKWIEHDKIEELTEEDVKSFF